MGSSSLELLVRGYVDRCKNQILREIVQILGKEICEEFLNSRTMKSTRLSSVGSWKSIQASIRNDCPVLTLSWISP